MEKRLYKVPEAMHILSIGRTQIYALFRAGRLRSVTEGRTRYITAKAIESYIALLESEADERGSFDAEAA